MATKRDINRFAKMTDAQKRVAIMKDVLEQLDAQKYIASSTYFRPLRDVWDTETQLITHESIRDKKCSLCAKGAIFVSRMGKFNDVGSFHSRASVADAACELGTTLPEFPIRMADDIESAFESCIEDTKAFEDATNEVEYDSPEFRELYSQQESWNKLPAENRLRLICANVIRNKGDFKPLELFDYEIVNV